MLISTAAVFSLYPRQQGAQASVPLIPASVCDFFNNGDFPVCERWYFLMPLICIPLQWRVNIRWLADGFYSNYETFVSTVLPSSGSGCLILVVDWKLDINSLSEI